MVLYTDLGMEVGRRMTATDQQVRRLRDVMRKTDRIGTSAARTGMCEDTARKYLSMGFLPNEMSKPHDGRTRPDPFEEVWPGIVAMLEREPQFDWTLTDHRVRSSKTRV